MNGWHAFSGLAAAVSALCLLVVASHAVVNGWPQHSEAAADLTTIALALLTLALSVLNFLVTRTDRHSDRHASVIDHDWMRQIKAPDGAYTETGSSSLDATFARFLAVLHDHHRSIADSAPDDPAQART